MRKKERFKVVSSGNPMIQQNYLGKIGRKIGEPQGMIHLDFGKHGQQTFYKNEVRKVPNRRRGR